MFFCGKSNWNKAVPILSRASAPATGGGVKNSIFYWFHRFANEGIYVWYLALGFKWYILYKHGQGKYLLSDNTVRDVGCWTWVSFGSNPGYFHYNTSTTITIQPLERSRVESWNSTFLIYSYYVLLKLIDINLILFKINNLLLIFEESFKSHLENNELQILV